MNRRKIVILTLFCVAGGIYSLWIATGSMMAMNYMGNGVEHLKKGNYDMAIKEFDDALRWVPELTMAYHHRGQAYFAKGNYESAIRDYNKAIRMKPKYGKFYYERGLADKAEGNNVQAKRDFERAKTSGYIHTKRENAN